MFYLPFFFLLMSYFVLLWASGAESWFNQELKAGATIETTGCQLICNLISSSGKQWIILFVCQYNAQNVNLRSSSNVSPGSQLMNLLTRLGYLQYQLSAVVAAVFSVKNNQRFVCSSAIPLEEIWQRSPHGHF